MTLHLHDDREPSGARPRDVPSGQDSANDSTVFSGSASLGMGAPSDACVQVRARIMCFPLRFEKMDILRR